MADQRTRMNELGRENEELRANEMSGSTGERTGLVTIGVSR